jgi:hypothetical protein
MPIYAFNKVTLDNFNDWLHDCAFQADVKELRILDGSVTILLVDSTKHLSREIQAKFELRIHDVADLQVENKDPGCLYGWFNILKWKPKEGQLEIKGDPSITIRFKVSRLHLELNQEPIWL